MWRFSTGAELAARWCFWPGWETARMCLTLFHRNSPANTTSMESPVAALATPTLPAPTARTTHPIVLGDDVLAVIEALKLQKPVLAGHSIAGEKLSSVGSRHPEMVSGLIYLDAGFPYAFYDRASGDPQLDMLNIRDRIEQLLPGGGYPAGQRQSIQALLASLPGLEKDLQKQLKLLDAIEPPTTNPTPPPPSHADVATAILEGEHKYTEIKVPCLAIFAVPHDPNSAAIPNSDAAHHAAAVAADFERMTNLADVFAAGVPSAQVIRLPNADHYVFRSNEGVCSGQ
jgi:pimeloyl-ACP methyl ester carboxylesterase